MKQDKSKHFFIDMSIKSYKVKIRILISFISQERIFWRVVILIMRVLCKEYKRNIFIVKSGGQRLLEVGEGGACYSESKLFVNMVSIHQTQVNKMFPYYPGFSFIRSNQSSHFCVLVSFQKLTKPFNCDYFLIYSSVLVLQLWGKEFTVVNTDLICNSYHVSNVK